MEVTEEKKRLIYDSLYGFIQISQVEWEIIHTPHYQRLRWIKQLGFSYYTFPGAEHSRYGHSIGVMFNAHCILKSIKLAVPDEELFSQGKKSKAAKYHQCLRLSALLHDLGTFCFSHTTEMAYIRFGETTNKKDGKGHPDDHEHLGSYIIKNTDYEGGITHILNKYEIDPQKISNLIKGIDPSVLANQILHSEIDCDRMDYLLRDAHYTGLQYGTYDRDYLLHHFSTVKVAGHNILVIKHNALHCVEDFLMSRFAWYSQVVRSARGAKFDAIAEEVTFFLLEKGYIYKYSELLEFVEKDPHKFYSFNDNYFMTLIHSLFVDGKLDKEPRIKDMVFSLLFGKSPVTIRSVEFKQRLLNQDTEKDNEKIIKKVKDKALEMQKLLEKKGDQSSWLLSDIPKKNIIFIRSKKNIVKEKNSENILLERDPTKILMENGDVKLLADMENSIIYNLQNSYNFVPNVFCSQSAHDLLEEEGLIK